MSPLILYIRTTIEMTACVDSCSSYDYVSATDLTVSTINTTTATVTVTTIDTSSCNPHNTFYQQLRIGMAVLWYLLLIYIMSSSMHPTIGPTSP